LHRQALKGAAFSPSVGKPWSHELSGRLRSLAPDLVADGEAAVRRARERIAASGNPVPTKVSFLGWACSSVRVIKAASIGCSVMHEPIIEDVAHANFVVFNISSDDDLEPVRKWLLNNLQVVKKSDQTILDSI